MVLGLRIGPLLTLVGRKADQQEFSQADRSVDASQSGRCLIFVGLLMEACFVYMCVLFFQFFFISSQSSFSWKFCHIQFVWLIMFLVYVNHFGVWFHNLTNQPTWNVAHRMLFYIKRLLVIINFCTDLLLLCWRDLRNTVAPRQGIALEIIPSINYALII